MARERTFAIPPELKPYLTYSVGVHFALALVLAKVLSNAAVASNPVYTIDFVGPSTTIISQLGPASQAQASAQTVAAKPAPDVKPDEFTTKKHHGKFVLPRPSLLKGYQQQPEEAPAEEQPAPATGKQAAATGAAGASGTPGDASVSADMPNFPYPWYIAQVRSALWAQWARRMPSQKGECTVVFTLLRNGAVTDLRTEDSSGDSGFDLAAMGAVQDAGPYPALPPGFADPFLKIHVTLKSN